MNPRELRQRAAESHRQAQELLQRAQGENRGLNAEETTQFDQLSDAFDRDIAEAQREERNADQQRQIEGAGAAGGETPPVPEGQPDPQAAFRKWLRTGYEGLEAEERQTLNVRAGHGGQQVTVRMLTPEERAQTTQTDASGGDLIAPLFYQQLTEAMLAFGGMRESPATKITTDTGADLAMPTSNDTSNEGVIIGENVQVTEQDLAFAQKVLTSHLFSSKSVLVPYTLLQDSAFPLDAFIGRKLGERLARVQNRKFTVGAGTTEPFGIVPEATVGKTGGTGQTTSVTYDDLVDLMHSVDPAYRNANCRWMFADSTLKALRKIVDDAGRPLWNPGMAGMAQAYPTTLLDYGYIVNQHMAAMAANAKSILFGDFSTFYIRDVRDITVLRLVERYADYLQVGFIAFARADSGLLDAGTHPVKVYANSAT